MYKQHRGGRSDFQVVDVRMCHKIFGGWREAQSIGHRWGWSARCRSGPLIGVARHVCQSNITRRYIGVNITIPTTTKNKNKICTIEYRWKRSNILRPLIVLILNQCNGWFRTWGNTTFEGFWMTTIRRLRLNVTEPTDNSTLTKQFLYQEIQF